MREQFGRIAIAAVLSLGVQSAVAGTWHFLEHPALTGLWPGEDGLWDVPSPAVPGIPAEGPFVPLPISGFLPANDFSLFPPFLPGPGTGAASTFVDSVGNFGSSVGTFVTNSGAPDGVGINTLTSFAADSLVHNDASSFVNFSYPSFLSPAPPFAPSFTDVAPDGRTYAAFATIEAPTLGSRSIFAGSGFNLYPTEDPFLVIGDPMIAAHFAFLLPLAPAGWEILSTTLWSYEVFDIGTGASLGITGSSVGVAYTFDAPVPIPPAVVLFGSALALLRVRKMRKS